MQAEPTLHDVPGTQGLTIRPLAGLGAEVSGVDLRALGDADILDIKRAWYTHDVLLFRRQRLGDDDLLRFSRHFGDLDSPPNQGAGRKSPPGFPDVYVVSNVLDDQGEPIGALGAGEASWHTDMSYTATPPDASMLYALELPRSGGDTHFCSMKVALQNLPADLRALAYQIRIKHDGTYDSGGTIRKGLTAPTSPLEAAGCLHPAVIEHPVSGAHALYLGRRLNAYIEGMPLSESERILGRLWAGVEAATYRHCWQLGDLVMWDNRTTMHRRDAFDNAERRVMHRTQIKNSSPIRGAKPHEPMLIVR